MNDTMVTIESASELARDLLDQHGLNDWKFEIEYGNKSMDRLGVCVYSEKTVKVSHWVFTDLNEEVEDTLRHEIAHAKVGPGNGHGLRWKMAAKNLGAKPRECHMNGIPQNLRIKIDQARKEREEREKPQSCPPVKPTEPPVTYQIPVLIEKRGDLFSVVQGTEIHFTEENLQLAIAKASIYCAKRRAQLIIPFHNFHPTDFSDSM